MGKAKQFAKNSFWLTVSTVVVIMIGAVYRPIIARMLGPADLGRYGFITTFVAYFTILAQFGIRQVVTREVGRDRGAARALLLTSCKLRAITILVALAACYLIGHELHKGIEVTIGIFIMGLSVVTIGIGELFEGVLIAYERSFYIAAVNLVGGLLRLGFGLWALKTGYGLMGVLTVFVSISALSSVATIWFVGFSIRTETQHRVPGTRVRRVARESFPFFILSVATKLYAKNDVIVLGLMRSDAITGLYVAAYTFVDLLLALCNSVNSAAYPLVSRLYGGPGSDGSGLVDPYERLHKYLLLVLLPACVVLTLVGRDVLLLVFGKEFARGMSLLQVLVWTPPAEVSCMISGTFLCATYQQKLDAKIASSMTALNIVVTVVLVYLYGAIGAAIATVGAAAVNAVLHFIYVRRNVGQVDVVTTWIKPLVCAAIMMTVMLALSKQFWVLQIIAGLASYTAAVRFVKALDKEDKRMFLSLVKH